MAAYPKQPLDQASQSKRIVRIVFLTLVLDLLAFTMPLPLFPRIIGSFVAQEAAAAPSSYLWPSGGSSATLLSRTLAAVRAIRIFLFAKSGLASTQVKDERWDLTLLGGLLASLFSFCQFLISPRLGKLSDKYGRRPVLLATMVGNVLSAVLWLFSGSFGIYALSRVVGGLSEGNVQLSIAIISDSTPASTRARSLALVGIAFSLAFTLGPSFGAYLASRAMSTTSLSVPFLGTKLPLNVFAAPAALTVGLLVLETAVLYVRLPETRWSQVQEPEAKEGEKKEDKPEKVSRELVMHRLRTLEWAHGGFLFFFSGAEFTLTFLTFTLFDYTNLQNGKLLGFIGFLSALLQGGYTRRRLRATDGPFKLARGGIFVCSFSLALFAYLPFLAASAREGKAATWTLYIASAGLAYVSSTVVNSLNALASLECSRPLTDGKQVDRGHALGNFRSKGQLGRAVGPLFATGVYWTWGPEYCYAACALGAATVGWRMGNKMRKLGAAPARKVKAQ